MKFIVGVSLVGFVWRGSLNYFKELYSEVKKTKVKIMFLVILGIRWKKFSSFKSTYPWTPTAFPCTCSATHTRQNNRGVWRWSSRTSHRPKCHRSPELERLNYHFTRSQGQSQITHIGSWCCNRLLSARPCTNIYRWSGTNPSPLTCSCSDLRLSPCSCCSRTAPNTSSPGDWPEKFPVSPTPLPVHTFQTLWPRHRD